MKSKHPTKLSGIIKRHPDGFGFFIPDDRTQPDAYITKPNMRGIMSNDKVEVELIPEPGGVRFRGRVIRITQRAFNNVVGQVYLLNNDVPVLADSSFAWGSDLKLEGTDDLEDGQWVIAQIKNFPDHPGGFSGQVVQVLGDGLIPSQDNIRILYAHQIPQEFSKDCLEEASLLSAQTIKDELKNRTDLRTTPFITIDGSTAKDFDDAIYVEKNKEGFKLLVAIADVSFYVPEGSAIDKDAYERGTSTYLPNFVSPMLPEELSNELCSLKPNVDRLACVAEMQFDHSGQIVRTNFYEAVIKSHARVTYGEAQEIIEGCEDTPHESVRGQILIACEFAKILMKNRFKRGSLDLEIPETQVQVNDAGEVVDISQSQRLFAHRLIEEMMLAANVAVATFFVDKSAPSMFRIHEPPKELMIDKLEVYLNSLGVSVNLSGHGQQKKMTKALKEFEGKPEHKILSMLALRSMSQAKYSLENVGHFGLGFNNYLHFTSPIRRYPDLIVHRQLKAYSKASRTYKKLSEDDISSKSTWLSACEQRSVKAERQLISIKKARFMRQFLGQEFTGYISGIAKFGVFVSLRQYDIDGLVKIEEFPGDRFTYQEEFMKLVGERSGVEFKVGDDLVIQVAAVNEEEGQIDFKLVLDEDKAKEIKAKSGRGASASKTERSFKKGKKKAHRKGQPRRSGKKKSKSGMLEEKSFSAPPPKLAFGKKKTKKKSASKKKKRSRRK